MEYYVDNKPNYKVYLYFAIVPLYVGLALGKLYGTEVTLENLSRSVIHVLTHPWPFKITPSTPGMLALSFLIWMSV